MNNVLFLSHGVFWKSPFVPSAFKQNEVHIPGQKVEE